MKNFDGDHWTGLLFIVAIAVILTAIYALVEREARHERAMAAQGLCWQPVPGGRGYAKCLAIQGEVK